MQIGRTPSIILAMLAPEPRHEGNRQHDDHGDDSDDGDRPEHHGKTLTSGCSSAQIS